MLSPNLRRLAERRGLQLEFVDTLGRTIEASDESIRAVLAAMGDRASSDGEVAESLNAIDELERERLLDPVIICEAGTTLSVRPRRPLSQRIDFAFFDVDEPARERDLRYDTATGRLISMEPLAAGYHDLVITEDGNEHRARILAAPMEVFRGDPHRRWGLFAPLYAVRGSDDSAIGTYSDLGRLMTFARDAGASCVGTLPLYSTFLDTGFDPSPYAPVSRLFWNEAHLDVDGLGLPAGPLVDWREVARRKLEATLATAEAAFADPSTRERIERFERERPLVRLYAAFRARVDTERSGWRGWSDREIVPAEWEETPLARWYRWAQWRCESEIEKLASGDAGLYLDFPLGSSPDGFDVWHWRHLYVDGASIGAPPDLAYRQGQDWGFRPPHPEAMRDDGWRHWRDLIRRAMEPASMLRLDHVMGLHRMWWVPAERTADHGLYVHYAARELYAVLAIESHRASCVPIGEDLGTVPPQVIEGMKRHGVLGMWALERQLTHASADGDLAEITEDRVASIGTHDMPPFAAFLEGSDVEEKGRLGVIHPSRLDDERAKRPRVLEYLRTWLGEQGMEAPAIEQQESLLEAVLTVLAASPAAWLIVNLEDLWLETISQNIPTTTTERPNWRPRLKLTLDEMRSDERVRRLLSRVARERPGNDDRVAR